MHVLCVLPLCDRAFVYFCFVFQAEVGIRVAHEGLEFRRVLFRSFSSSLERVRFALTFTTLRLNMPQWQGGDEPAYRFGSELLRWLAPPHDGPEESVEVPEADGNPPPVDHGIKWRDA